MFTGLIEAVEPTDDELAAVIGHEIAHALREHTAERYSIHQRSQFFGMLLAAVANAAVQSKTGIDNSQAFSQLGSIGADVFGTLPYSREFEIESDRIGPELMARAGYDPQAALSFWSKADEKIQQQGGDTVTFLSTHPSSQLRIQRMQETIPSLTYLRPESMAIRNAAAPETAQ